MNTDVELLFCACGVCGQRVIRKGNKYINGHNGRNLIAWNKGIKSSEETKNKLKGRIPWNKGISHSEETRRKMSQNNSRYMLGKTCSEELKNKISEANIGKIHSDEWNSRVANSMRGKTHTEETKIKIGLSCKGKTKGRKYSEEIKQRMSISAKERVKRIGMGGVCEGNNERYILDIVENRIGIKILRNNKEVSRRMKGRISDGYLSQYNLPIEVLEKPHFRPTGELIEYDHIRQSEIASRLGCMIYYIPEQAFLKNQEQEIQRLKDFLLLLDQEIN